jgi:hypothetical protein|tara:strand:- start:443 stop:1177 length:735 start_codon:yes stop_codon:yes gene_type:complete
MPDPIYSAVTDGFVRRSGQSSWGNARDTADGTLAKPSDLQSSYAASAAMVSGRSGDEWYVYRSFFAFDTSVVSGPVSSASLKLYGYVNGDGNVIAVKCDPTIGLSLTTDVAVTDFDELENFVAGSTGSMNGVVTTYSAYVPTWSTIGYNSMSLNATARSDIEDDDLVIICLLEYDHDFLDVAPSAYNAYRSGCYYQEQSGTGKDPYLDYTLAGYGHTVTGVTSANISKVKGVATASIDKVIGVD